MTLDIEHDMKGKKNTKNQFMLRTMTSEVEGKLKFSF